MRYTNIINLALLTLILLTNSTAAAKLTKIDSDKPTGDSESESKRHGNLADLIGRANRGEIPINFGEVKHTAPKSELNKLQALIEKKTKKITEEKKCLEKDGHIWDCGLLKLEDFSDTALTKRIKRVRKTIGELTRVLHSEENNSNQINRYSQFTTQVMRNGQLEKIENTKHQIEIEKTLIKILEAIKRSHQAREGRFDLYNELFKNTPCQFFLKEDRGISLRTIGLISQSMKNERQRITKLIENCVSHINGLKYTEQHRPKMM